MYTVYLYSHLPPPPLFFLNDDNYYLSGETLEPSEAFEGFTENVPSTFKAGFTNNVNQDYLGFEVTRLMFNNFLTRFTFIPSSLAAISIIVLFHILLLHSSSL